MEVIDSTVDFAESVYDSAASFFEPICEVGRIASNVVSDVLKAPGAIKTISITPFELLAQWAKCFGKENYEMWSEAHPVIVKQIEFGRTFQSFTAGADLYQKVMGLFSVPTVFDKDGSNPIFRKPSPMEYIAFKTAKVAEFVLSSVKFSTYLENLKAGVPKMLTTLGKYAGFANLIVNTKSLYDYAAQWELNSKLVNVNGEYVLKELTPADKATLVLRTISASAYLALAIIPLVVAKDIVAADVVLRPIYFALSATGFGASVAEIAMKAFLEFEKQLKNSKVLNAQTV